MKKKLLGFVFLLSASVLYCSNKREQRDDVVGYSAFILKHWKTGLKVECAAEVLLGAARGAVGGAASGAVRGPVRGAIKLAIVKYVMKN